MEKTVRRIFTVTLACGIAAASTESRGFDYSCYRPMLGMLGEAGRQPKSNPPDEILGGHDEILERRMNDAVNSYRRTSGNHYSAPAENKIIAGVLAGRRQEIEDRLRIYSDNGVIFSGSNHVNRNYSIRLNEAESLLKNPNMPNHMKIQRLGEKFGLKTASYYEPRGPAGMESAAQSGPRNISYYGPYGANPDLYRLKPISFGGSGGAGASTLTVLKPSLEAAYREPAQQMWANFWNQPGIEKWSQEELFQKLQRLIETEKAKTAPSP